MYTLALRREFESSHALIGGDWGAENEPHSHQYLLELRLEAAELNQHGYIVDLLDLEASLDQILGRFAEQHLNDLDEFAGLNPSLEHFARILAEALAAAPATRGLSRLTVQLWEDAQAWASYQLEL